MSYTEKINVAVLDMQPIDPPVGGGRIRLLGLYHALGGNLPTTYVGTYDWPGEQYRHHELSPTLTEIDVPLTETHFAACKELQDRVGGKTIIDVSFPLLAQHSPEFIREAQKAVVAADVVIFSHPWVHPLVRNEIHRETHVVIYDSQNVEGMLRHTLLDDGDFGTELVGHVVQFEYEVCHAADLILACSHEDRELFHRLYNVPFSKVLVVPNGTFTGRTLPAEELARAQSKLRLGLGTDPVAIFLASAYPPNIEAADFICRVLAPALPHVTFALCGGVGDQIDGTALKARGLDNVRVSGTLSEDNKQAYLAAADLAINPMFSGSGTNIKMFDFMAAGLPIVSTPVGARGITQGPEKAIHICPAEELIAAIGRVVTDTAYAQSLGQAARRLVEETYSWERISAQLGTLVGRCKARFLQPAPFFSVIVPSYERHDHLNQLLDCLQAQTWRDFEIIVVDQSRQPWQRDAKYADLDIFYVHMDVKGAVKARNTAAFYARGHVLAFTDDDCHPRPDWLQNAWPYFSRPRVVGVEGLIVSDKREDPNYRPVTNIGFEGIGFMTANLFLRRETFNAINGFDERFDRPHFREDTDLGWRALAYGDIPFAQDVTVYHPPHLRTVARESLIERSRFFEKDALLLHKHPEMYRTLFLKEAQYAKDEGFRENFLRGAEKYGVEIDGFYLSLLNRHLGLRQAG